MAQGADPSDTRNSPPTLMVAIYERRADVMQALVEGGLDVALALRKFPDLIFSIQSMGSAELTEAFWRANPPAQLHAQLRTRLLSREMHQGDDEERTWGAWFAVLAASGHPLAQEAAQEGQPFLRRALMADYCWRTLFQEHAMGEEELARIENLLPCPELPLYQAAWRAWVKNGNQPHSAAMQKLEDLCARDFGDGTQPVPALFKKRMDMLMDGLTQWSQSELFENFLKASAARPHLSGLLRGPLREELSAKCGYRNVLLTSWLKFAQTSLAGASAAQIRNIVNSGSTQSLKLLLEANPGLAEPGGPYCKLPHDVASRWQGRQMQRALDLLKAHGSDLSAVVGSGPEEKTVTSILKGRHMEHVLVAMERKQTLATLEAAIAGPAATPPKRPRM